MGKKKKDMKVELGHKRANLYKKYEKVRAKNRANQGRRKDRVYGAKATVASSQGEKRIAKCLTEQDVEFYQEYTFKDLINPETNYPLRFDFYIPSLNLCMEFDGKQHFSYVKDFYGPDKKIGLKKLASQKRRDRMKDRYCVDKGIRLLRIKYTRYNEIEKIIKEVIDVTG